MISVSSLVMVRPRPVPGTDKALGHAAALERLEDARQVGGLDADAGIADLELATWPR